MSTTALSTRIKRGLAWSTASNVILRVGNFSVSIIMARIIAPDEFGVFAVALTTWTVLGTLAEFGLGADLVRSRDPERKMPTVASMGLITAGVLALSMAVGASTIARTFNSPASTDVIRLMAFGLMISGFSVVPGAILQREFRQRTLFAISASALSHRPRP